MTALTVFILVALATIVFFLRRSSQKKSWHSLAPEVEALEGVQKELEHFLSKQTYARDSQRIILVARCKAALRVTRASSWRSFSSGEQKRVAATVSRFLADSVALTRAANAEFVPAEIQRYKHLFDHVESNPLTDAQQIACVTNEDNNLVLAGAGTGKTSTMIGRTGYLLASELAQSDQILLLAFAKRAAEELEERIETRLAAWHGGRPPKVKTFHALGLEIVGRVERKRPRLTPMAEDSSKFSQFVDRTLDVCLLDRTYRRKFIKYFQQERYPYRSPFDFDSMQDYREYVGANELRTLNGDVVKSFEEALISNFLSANGILFEYERRYEKDTRTPDFSQYRPDFYLVDYGIYIEHFALDKSGMPPQHFNQKRYLDGITWKRKLHEENKTILIETYSHLRWDGRLEEHLKSVLEEAGVAFAPKSSEKLLDELREGSLVSDFAQLLSDFITLFKTAAGDLEDLETKATAHADRSRILLLLDLIVPIVKVYDQHLKTNGEIDFADMIWRAVAYVTTGEYRSPYRHILVDEFQDISGPRAKLIKGLLNQDKNQVFYAVGDDWQSIYRFTGSDISYTRDFAKGFGATATTALDLTFRFNQEISDLASRFVLRNPDQIQKSIRSNRSHGFPAVSLIRVLERGRGLSLALNAVSEIAKTDQVHRPTVLILGRYHFVLEDWVRTSAGKALRGAHPRLDIQFSTVHAAKGKEADYVIVLDLVKGGSGFPSQKPTDPLLEFLLPPAEPFPHAEERRLFYVAVTRARHRAYLVYNPMIASEFVQELLAAENGFNVCDSEIESRHMAASIPAIPCPQCRTGRLVLRMSSHGPFVGCNNFPFCRYTERPCPECGGLMRRTEKLRICAQPHCDAEVPICQRCGGDMVERTGPYGRFWGCLNYRKDVEHCCTNRINIERHQHGSGSPQKRS
jgi:DNA helicase IV